MWIRTWAAAAAMAVGLWAAPANALLVIVQDDAGNEVRFTETIGSTNVGEFDPKAPGSNSAPTIGFSLTSNSFSAGAIYQQRTYYEPPAPGKQTPFVIYYGLLTAHVQFDGPIIADGVFRKTSPPSFFSFESLYTVFVEDCSYPFGYCFLNDFSGRLPGSGTWDTTKIAFVANVPEPSTWALMMIGFAGLALAGRKRIRGGRADL
jgi:hypothetical protein